MCRNDWSEGAEVGFIGGLVVGAILTALAFVLVMYTKGVC